jgi:hypothetical protein
MPHQMLAQMGRGGMEIGVGEDGTALVVMPTDRSPMVTRCAPITSRAVGRDLPPGGTGYR